VNQLTHDVSAALEAQKHLDHDLDIDSAISNILWKEARRYRISITVSNTHASGEGRESPPRKRPDMTADRRKGALIHFSYLKPRLPQPYRSSPVPLAPRTLICAAVSSISRRSSAVSSVATAPRFSSRRSSFRVPGIGTIHGFRALADKLLIAERAIGFSGVEEGDATLHSGAKDRDHSLFVTRRTAVGAHSHAAEAKRRHFEAAVSEFALLHLSSPSANGDRAAGYYAQTEAELREQLIRIIDILRPYARSVGHFHDLDDVRTRHYASNSLARARGAAGELPAATYGPGSRKAMQGGLTRALVSPRPKPSTGPN
jgi:hypothetical protein